MRRLEEKEIEAVAGGGCGSRIPEYDAPSCFTTYVDAPSDGGEDDEFYYFHDDSQGGGATVGTGGIFLRDGDAEDLAWHRSIVNLLGALRETFVSSPNSWLDLGGGRGVHYSQALSALNLIRFTVTADGQGGVRGASTVGTFDG